MGRREVGKFEMAGRVRRDRIGVGYFLTIMEGRRRRRMRRKRGRRTAEKERLSHFPFLSLSLRPSRLEKTDMALKKKKM